MFGLPLLAEGLGLTFSLLTIGMKGQVLYAAHSMHSMQGGVYLDIKFQIIKVIPVALGSNLTH